MSEEAARAPEAERLAPEAERLAQRLPDGEPLVQRLRVHRVSMPLAEPIRSGMHSIDAIHTVLVEAHGAEQVGVGYAFAFSENEALAVAAIAEDLLAVVQSTPARGVREHWAAMARQLDFVGLAGPGGMALAAIDTALWDLHARRAGLPMHAMLGAAARPVKLYGAGGWLSWSVERVIEEARSFAQAGYGAYKMRAGSPDWRADVARVRAVREALPPELDLMIDVNQAWSYEVARRAGGELEELGLLWIEEPLDAHDFDGQATLARELRTPIAAGETLWGVRELRRLVDSRAADVVQLDLMRCGGVTPFLAVAALVDASARALASHMFTPMCAHLLAVCEHAYLAEHLPSWFDALFDQQPQAIDGRLLPCAGPGFGLTISASTLERFGHAR
ncbi:MAG: mandelate racemase/muconate lactonizing enzyme family protein [Solirubrobacteraceae bacterium]